MKINRAAGGPWIQLLVLLALSLARGFSQTNVTCAPPPSGLVDWWQAEGKAADIISGGVGTLYPGTTYAPGEVGQAFAFDGVNGCVMNTNTPALTYIQNNFTIEFWANPQKGFTIPPQSPDYLNDADQSFAIFPDWGGSAGPAGVGVCVGTNGVAVLEHAYNYLPSLLSYTNALNGWVHVAVVYSNKQPSLYINGAWVQTGLTSTRAYVYPSKTFGGSYDTSAGPPFNFQSYGPYQGLLDEISIYNRALSAGEIQSIYSAGSSGKCPSGTAPSISAQPVSQSVNAGGTATFNVDASGSPQLSFQWSFNGTNISGATNITLSLPGVQPANAGWYAVTVTNQFGVVISSNATLTVLTSPPVISSQPTNLTVNAGGTASFGVVASGPPQLSYQWSLNGTNLYGATNSVISLSGVQPTNAGLYAVTVSNPYGAVLSSNALLTVLTFAPVITAQPVSHTILANGTATFSVAASGSPILSYQWSFDGTNLTGDTGNVLALASVQAANGGNYAVTVSNPYGTVTSSNALLTVVAAPACDPPPSGITGWWQAEGNAADVVSGKTGTVYAGTSYGSGEVGEAFTFNGSNGCVMNTNTPALTNIQNNFTIEFWAYPQKSFSILPQGPNGGLGTSRQSFAVFPDWGGNGGQAGVGVCVGTNGIAVMEHAAGYLPSLLSYTNPLAGWVHVAVVYTNKQPSLYVNGVWVKTGVASARTFVYPSKNFGSSYDTSSGSVLWTYGPYQGLLDEISIYNRAMAASEIQAIYVAGSAGKCYSGTPPVVTSQPTNATVNAGDTAVFKVTAGGSPQLSFQWMLNGSNLAGATNSSLSLANVQPANAGVYQVVVTNRYGSTISSNAVLTVVTYPPVLTLQPVSQTVNANSSVTFSAAATGNPPVSFHWLFNGTNLSGATANSLTIASVQPANAGLYQVVATNLYGAVTSSNATLTVLTFPPVITSQPTNQTITVNQGVTFAVTATGTAPFSYQWRFNSSILSGATNNLLTLPDVQTNNAGAYQVTVSNPYGSVTSSSASLTVVPPPPCDPPPAGIADWWPADGNPNDIITGGVGTLYPGTGYTNGIVGQAFSFDGVSGCVMNDDTPPLTNIQDTFTIEFWALPEKSFNLLPEGEAGGLGNSGQSYAIFPDWGGDGGQAGVGISVGTNGISVLAHADSYLPSLLSYPVYLSGWVHVAVVFTNKQPTLYLNGVNVHTGVVSSRTFVYPSKNLGNSYDSAGGFSFQYYGPYQGLLDEVSIYNRALGAGEIQAIYAAGAGGKCTPSNVPVVTLQPTNQTVGVGGSVTFSFAVSGLPQLTYQWLFNGTNIVGATNISLTLSNLSAASSGIYQATVANAYGATTTSNATLTVVLPPGIVQQPQSQSVASFNSATFTVVADGLGTYTYQWQKNGVNLSDGGNISGSASPSLTLASVGMSDAGNYDVLVSNAYATTNSAVAVLTVPETVVSLGSTNAMSGGLVTVPVWMNALGVESLLAGSVGYDPTKLVFKGVQLAPTETGAYLLPPNVSQTNNGYVGFAISFASVAPAGLQPVAQLVFQTLPVTNTTTINLILGDIPTGRQLLDENFDSLPLLSQNGTVTLSPAEYAADVYPRFNGDHQVNFQDWLEEGRMVAGLDVPTNSDELLRADCAPRNAPDGLLTVADWVQAGRYALGLDPLTLVSAPAAPASKPVPLGIPIPTRTLQIATVPASRGQTVSVPVQLVCTANENAAGLTVDYNPAFLKLTSVTQGAVLAGGRLYVNTNSPGKVGLVLALAPGSTLPAGTNQVAVLQFVTGTNAANTQPLTLAGNPVALGVADEDANSLTANYVSGAIVLPAAPTLQVTATGNNLTLTWPVGLGTYQVLSATNPAGPWQALSLVISSNGVNATVSVPATNQQQYFRLSGE